MHWELFLRALIETILMSVTSTTLAYVIGLPIGIILHSTSKKGLHPNKIVNSILGVIVNILRSIPCVLLIIILIPVTNIFFGKGSWSGDWFSMIVPLVVASFPFVARMVESSLNEVDEGLISAMRSLGTSDFQIIIRVLLPEAMPSLLSGLAISSISIIGYTSFAGYISAGGLISQGFNWGFYGTNKFGMWMCILGVVILVQIIQELGLFIAKKIDKRR